MTVQLSLCEALEACAGNDPVASVTDRGIGRILGDPQSCAIPQRREVSHYRGVVEADEAAKWGRHVRIAVWQK